MTKTGFRLDKRVIWRATMMATGMLAWGTPSVPAAVAGAWESFFDQINTDAWLVDDWVSAQLTTPLWSGTPEGAEYAYFNYVADNPVSFIADSYVGTGELVGDYDAEWIAAVSCWVFIGEVATLDWIECAVLATGPEGPGYYYSEPYYGEEFTADGWWPLWFDFDRPWYFYDGSNRVPVNGTSLTAIKQIQFTFFPWLDSTGGSEVGLDDVTLEPTVVAPELTTSVTAGTPGNFRLAFTPGPGLQCRVEKMRTAPATGWNTVVGQTGIKGPGEHVMLRPLTPPMELFRVAAEPFYTGVFTE